MNYGTRNDRKKVLELLFSRAGVKLSTSWTDRNNMVRGDYIVVHEAAPATVAVIVRDLVMVSLIPEGLLIPTNDPQD